MTAVKDDYNFNLVGTEDTPFGGYFSDPDPTRVQPNLTVGGSKNVYKKDNGNYAVRPGLKRYLGADRSDNGTVASFEWQTSFGETRIIRVLAEGQWQFLYNDEWLTVEDFEKTRFVFSPWWSDQIQQEILVMVNGDNAIHSWTGGAVSAVGTMSNSAVLINGDSPTEALTATTINAPSVAVGNNGAEGGSAYSAFVLAENPAVDETIQLVIARTSPFDSGTASIVFTDDVSGSPGGLGLVLIGATKEETAANLLGFLNDPGNSSATHRAITGAATIAAINAMTCTEVQALPTADGSNWSASGFTDGFPSAGSELVSNGTTYTYTLVAGEFLVNISGQPTQSDTAYQNIITNTGLPAEDYAADFCATITNQVIIGSYTSSVMYFSADTNYLDFTNTGDLIEGDPDNIVLDELPRGVIVVNESAYIPAGSGNWYICTPNTPVPVPFTIDGSDRYVIVKVEKKLGAAKTAALAHEFLSAIADTIIYLGQDNQLRMFGIFKDLLGTKYPSISQAVKDELMAEDFTGGQLRAIGERIYLIAPLSGKTYIYEQRDDVTSSGNIVSERLWQPPFEWNISRIAVINDIEYGYSASSPETYQLWNTNQYHDDSNEGPMPYECVLRFGYWQFRDRARLGDLDKVFLEGYMPENTPLKISLRNDYLGSTGAQDVIVSDLDDSAVLYTENGVLIGQSLLGNTLVGGATGQTGLPKFRAIPQFTKLECFEYQVELYSYALDAQWELLCMGTNGSQVINKTPYLIKG